MYNIKDFTDMAAMKYYNNEKDCPKRQEMITNKDNKFMATVKNDGNWAMIIHYADGSSLIRSRSISTVTNTYGNYTFKLPHITDALLNLHEDIVLLVEICWDEPNTNANTVGTILRCLDHKAVARQAEHKLKAVVFDCLYYNKDLTKLGYEERFKIANDIVSNLNSDFIYMTRQVLLDDKHPDFLTWADEIIKNGGEGLVIQRKDAQYIPDSRTAWQTLKLKQSLPEMELVVVDTVEPTKLYNGDNADNWEYSVEENGEKILVTKPYFFGWKKGIVVELPDGTRTNISSGLTDADCEWLATKEAAEIMAHKELIAVVKAMSFNDLGKLRHAYVVRLRNKNDM